MIVCTNGLLMELGELLATLMRGHTYKQIADATGLSKGTLSQIVQGQTQSPDPKTLARLARYFGKTEVEQREIYEQMMSLAGYLELLPQGAGAYAGSPLTLPDRMLAVDQLQEAVAELIADYSTDDAEKALGFFERLRREDPEGFRGYVSWRLAVKRANEEGRR